MKHEVLLERCCEMATHNSLEHFHNAFINLTQIGCVDNVQEFHPIYCFRDMHTIHYVKKGSGYLQIKEQSISLKAGDTFYIPPCCPATYGTYEEDVWEAYYFAFNGCYADELLNKTIFKNNQFVGHLEKGDELAEIIFAASEEIKTHSYPQFYGLEQLFKLLPFIIQERKTNALGTKEKHLTLCKEYIDTHYNEDLQISDVAQAVHLSVNYIYRLFKEVLNTSPHDYLTTVRMQYAKTYLIDTDISTQEIASHLGYTNYTTFYSMFNKRMRMSPHEYRLLQTNGRENVEDNSATTIRMFRNIEDCRMLEFLAGKELQVEDDVHYNSCPLESSYLRRFKYKQETYDLYAYVYAKPEDARQYFKNATEITVQGEAFDFKIKHKSDSTILVVINENCVYKLIGGELRAFNEFRHVVNEIFTQILLN